VGIEHWVILLAVMAIAISSQTGLALQGHRPMPLHLQFCCVPWPTTACQLDLGKCFDERTFTEIVAQYTMTVNVGISIHASLKAEMPVGVDR
jgi:hypothetical protein